ncbi:formylglycine-generating enzyme family protein [Pseudoalteromonas denitrificans]|uniref:Formylglycine-generating enzyme, required for sulfatase activity, contains SUMF1/FGE domain n=1 Tax=Pseudoalteromonas denitrificans DSM 6059 TaxID=1123010 RepID=A0A1I1SKD3_9GAMM|nr:formylglycine-generating enzyme family protein [Pseudoalteromonas denitrificans]SFD43490.1 Formylglycine-generating enzyme, required for sulfatase activity, contains SUMF1/FGE domain [Pseudoalteromonas denitrificans DSM 6059]
MNEIPELKIKTELRVLYAKISDLLVSKGEISQEDKIMLLAMAHAVGLDNESLDSFIAEIEINIKAKILPLQNWLKSLNKYSSKIHLDEKTKAALLDAGKSIGLSEQQVTNFFNERSKVDQSSNKFSENNNSKIEVKNTKLKISINHLLLHILRFKNKALLLITIIAFTFTSIYWFEHFEAEENAWMLAKKSDNIKSYQNFTKKFDKGDYSALAQSRRDELEYKKWQATKIENTQSVYASYIELNTQSRYLKQAQENLNKLIHDEENALQQQDETDWQQALIHHNEVSYTKYLARTGQKKYLSQAKKKLLNLVLQRQKNESSEDNEMWSIAKKINSEQSYLDYIKANPEGQHYKLALNNVEKFKAKREFLHLFDVQFITIPAGSFSMGAKNISSYEVPIHEVNVKSFNLMSTEVTFALWDACYKDKACTHKPKSHGQRGKQPVINIHWHEITKQFIPWFNNKTGQKFRLPSEAEWEYAARAGSDDKFSWGDRIDCSKARFGYYSNECSKQKSPDNVKTYPPNDFGLYDMHGNVKELVQDCWNDNFKGAPIDGEAWLTGRCDKAVLRDGSFKSKKSQLRLGVRYRHAKNSRVDDDGFRLAQDLN